MASRIPVRLSVVGSDYVADTAADIRQGPRTSPATGLATGLAPRCAAPKPQPHPYLDTHCPLDKKVRGGDAQSQLSAAPPQCNLISLPRYYRHPSHSSCIQVSSLAPSKPRQSISLIEGDQSRQKSKGAVESHAEHIRLAHVPIVRQDRGWTRVARATRCNPIRSTIADEVDDLVHLSQPIISNPSSELQQQDPAYLRSQTSEHYTDRATHQNGSTQVSRTAYDEGLNRLPYPSQIKSSLPSYQYCPPAAAKYYLWDSTRLSPAYTLSPESLCPEIIQFKEMALKSFRIHCTKIELLATANMPVSGNPELADLDTPTGFFLGRIQLVQTENSSPNSNNLARSSDSCTIVVDRFDAGRHQLSLAHPRGQNVPSVVDNTDIVIPVYLSKSSKAQSSETYSSRLLRLLQTLDCEYSDTFSQTYRGFPLLVDAFFDMTSGQVKLDGMAAVRHVSIEVSHIRALRIVATSLAHELSLTDYYGATSNGFMSIDHARHLYLLEELDAKAKELPLIGLWFKSQFATISSPYIHTACIRYITDKSLIKLDTGKNTFLVCLFVVPSSGDTGLGEEAHPPIHSERSFPSQHIKPLVFECTFTIDKTATQFFISEEFVTDGSQCLRFLAVDSMSKEHDLLRLALESFYKLSFSVDEHVSPVASINKQLCNEDVDVSLVDTARLENHHADSLQEPSSPQLNNRSETDCTATKNTTPTPDSSNIIVNVQTTSPQSDTTQKSSAPLPKREDSSTNVCLPSEYTVQTRILPEMEPNQLWYLSMLQRQVEMLQTQISAFSEEKFRFSNIKSTTSLAATCACASKSISAKTSDTIVDRAKSVQDVPTPVEECPDFGCTKTPLVKLNSYGENTEHVLKRDVATNTSSCADRECLELNQGTTSWKLQDFISENTDFVRTEPLSTKDGAGTESNSGKVLHEPYLQFLDHFPSSDGRGNLTNTEEDYVPFFQSSQLMDRVCDKDMYISHLDTVATQNQTASIMVPFEIESSSISKFQEEQPTYSLSSIQSFIIKDKAFGGKLSSKDIIASLVSDPEKSFVYNDRLDVSDVSLIEISTVDSSHNVSSNVMNRESSTIVTHEPYSRASLDYLGKYGLLD
ncbi:hypothetical protein BASA50_010433 [Batrachochytrium salamandrivorans]|uniref:STIL N-terminal domain-containing protein n=1 Tax=Batrachochytrium salamandrivorans TaxID=1357716 RepID=A0ABQ8EYH7_9FUNG|nr:hypothetical protein BASA50_010433 [Batrachochytrium salamandrivorans]